MEIEDGSGVPCNVDHKAFNARNLVPCSLAVVVSLFGDLPTPAMARQLH
jgi:hypothetical protein